MHSEVLRRLLPLGAALLLAACSDAGPAATTPTPDLEVRAAPTVPPPAWVESAGVITLENANQLAYLGRLDGPAEPSTIFAHAIAPDGTRLAGLDNDQLIVWDLISGERAFGTARQDANRVYYAPDKTEVYLLSTTGTVLIIDALAGIEQTRFEAHPDFNSQAAFHNFDGWLAVGGRDGTIKVWDPLERQSLVTLRAHDLAVTALAFSPDGALLASYGDDGRIRVWDWRARTALATIEARDVLRLRIAPRGDQIAAATRERVLLFALPDGTPVDTIDAGPGGTDILQYAPDGRYLLTGGSAAVEMSLWDPASGALAARLPGVGGDRVDAAFSPDGEMLLTSVLGGPVSLWNLDAVTATTLGRYDLENDGRLIFGVDWTDDDRLLTLFGASGSVYIWGIGAG